MVTFGAYLTTDYRPLTIVMDWHETEIRVRYAETDAMGIVHHANFLVWFEAGRSEFCRSRGFAYKDLEEQENALMVVAEAYCRYKNPAYYDDILTVRTKVLEVRSRSVRFFYEVHRKSDDMLIAEGETQHVFTDREQRVRTLPIVYRDLLRGEEKLAFPAGHAPS